MNNWHLTVHFTELCLNKTLFCRAPLRVFNEEAIDIHTFIWSFRNDFRIVIIKDAERELKQINWFVVLSCISLEYACNKSMRKEES